MYEYIFRCLALYKAIALAGVKPLHGSLFFAHFVFLFSSLKLSGALLRIPSRRLPSSAAFCGSAQRAQKKAASLTSRPLHKTKGDTRATNANSVYQETPPFCKWVFDLYFSGRHLPKRSAPKSLFRCQLFLVNLKTSACALPLSR